MLNGAATACVPDRVRSASKTARMPDDLLGGSRFAAIPWGRSAGPGPAPAGQRGRTTPGPPPGRSGWRSPDLRTGPSTRLSTALPCGSPSILVTRDRVRRWLELSPGKGSTRAPGWLAARRVPISTGIWGLRSSGPEVELAGCVRLPLPSRRAKKPSSPPASPGLASRTSPPGSAITRWGGDSACEVFAPAASRPFVPPPAANVCWKRVFSMAAECPSRGAPPPFFGCCCRRPWAGRGGHRLGVRGVLVRGGAPRLVLQVDERSNDQASHRIKRMRGGRVGSPPHPEAPGRARRGRRARAGSPRPERPVLRPLPQPTCSIRLKCQD